MTKNGPKWTKRYDKQTFVKFSGKMVYWVENDEIGRKEVKEVENVQTETKWSLGDEKRGARNVKRGQN